MLDSLQQCTSGVIELFIVAGTRCWWRCLCKRHCFGYCLRPCRPAGRLECVQCCSPKGSMNCNLWLTRVLLVLACTYTSLGSSPTTNQPTCTNCSHTHAFLHNTHVHATHRFGDNTLQDHINARSLEQLSSYCSRYKEHFGSASELKAADKCVTVWLH